jgi:ankyrin repeat protein
MMVVNFDAVFDQTTPLLHGACYFGHLDVVKILIKYLTIQFDLMNCDNPNKLSEIEFNRLRKADLKSKVNKLMVTGHSALYLACQRGFIDIVKCLVEHGAETTILYPAQYTALSVYIYIHIFQFLQSISLCAVSPHTNKL